LVYSVCYHVLLNHKRNETSPIASDLSLEPKPLQPNVNPIQKFVRVSHKLFELACIIPWDATIFGVDDNNIPLYIAMQDVFEII